ncbi:MAG: DUF6056 family protein [Chloroflexota bacterium]
MNKLFSATCIFFALTAALALGLYAYLASLMRPIGDDYCITARLIGYDPLFASLYKYWHTSPRFSNEFVAWFTDLFGPRGVAVFSVGCLVLWVIGLIWLLSESSRALRIQWNFWTGLLLAELIVLLSYYTSANLFQSVLWRPGAMTYLLPLVSFSFVFAMILRGARVANGGRASLLTITLLFFLAFFTGGLSETAGALHISILGLALVVNFIWNKGATRRASLALITAALAGALLAMVGMLITPANMIRQADPPSIFTVLQRAFTFGLQFLSEAARLLKIPALFALGAGALIGYTSVTHGGMDKPSARANVIALIVVPLLTYLLIVASFAPSAYGQSYPLERVRFPAHSLLVISLLLEGGLIGLLVARISLPRWITNLAVLALLVAAFYPLWVTRNNLAFLPDFQTRAAQWDFRDARIRDLAASGEKEIVVWQLPGIENVKDLDTRKGHWINYCAAIYYGVDTIAAPQGQTP